MRKLLLFISTVLMSTTLFSQPFGNYVSLDGINDNIYLVHSNANFVPGNSDFTIELFFYTCDAGSLLFDFQGSSAGTGLDMRMISNTRFRAASQPADYATYKTYDINVPDMRNQWHHIAWVFTNSDSMNYIYYDGDSIFSFKQEAKGSSTDIGIGSDDDSNADVGMQGFMDEFRISNTARYSGNTYVVPTDSFTLDGNTHFLVHFDEVKGSLYYKDAGPNHYYLTSYWGAHIVEPLSIIEDTALTVPGTVQLWVKGGTLYSWSPSTGLSDTAIANPVTSATSSITYYATVSDTNGCYFTDSVFVDVTVNSDNIVAEKIPMIYPNPTKGEVSIQIIGSQQGIINVYDLSGKLMMQQEYTSARLALTLSALPAGSYIIEVTDEQDLVLYKDIILKQ